MSTLNRSSYWTTANGGKLRVKHMSIDQIHQAIFQLEQLELQELESDPYIVGQICANLTCCTIHPEPEHKINGFFLDDWHDLLSNEIEKRLKFLYGLPIRHAPKVKKTNFLVKWLKSW